jgi:hypothetical protein
VAGHGPISLFLLLLYSIRQDALQKQKDPFATNKQKSPSSYRRRRAWKNPGNVLLSHPVARIVPSALEGLTSKLKIGRGTGMLSFTPLFSFRDSPRGRKNGTGSLCHFLLISFKT